MKKLKYLALGLMMAATTITPTFAENIEMKFKPGNLFYYVNEESKPISNELYIKNDNIMMSLKNIKEVLNLGDNLVWDSYADTLTIYVEDKILQFKMNDNTIYTNEGKISMDVAPEYNDLEPMFPIEDLAKHTNTKYENKDGSLIFNIDKPDVIIEYDYDYNKLLELAYKSSRELIKVDLSIEKAEELKDDAKSTVKSIPLNIDSGPKAAARTGAYMKFRSHDMAKKVAEKNVDKTKEQIQFKLKELYYELLKSKENVSLAKLGLDVATDAKNQALIMYENGMVSELDKNKAIKGYDETNHKYEMAQKAEKIAYEALNYYVGLNPDEVYTLDDKVDMQEINELDMNINSHIPNIMSKSPDIWALEQKVELAEDGLNLFVFNVGNNYTTTKIDLKTTKIQLNEAKEKYEETLRKLNTQIKVLNNQYATDKLNYDKAKDDFELAKLNEALGLAIPLDVKKAELQLSQKKNAMNETVRNYNKLVDIYLKPWVKQ